MLGKNYLVGSEIEEGEKFFLPPLVREKNKNKNKTFVTPLTSDNFRARGNLTTAFPSPDAVRISRTTNLQSKEQETKGESRPGTKRKKEKERDK